MAADKRNAYLDHGLSDESDSSDAGYDSEAAEVSKTGRASKRRKVEHDSSDDEVESDPDTRRRKAKPRTVTKEVKIYVDDSDEDKDKEDDHEDENEGDSKTTHVTHTSENLHPRQKSTSSPTEKPSKHDKTKSKNKNKSKDKSKETPPGVIYLSSLPPYLKPSALRNLLLQRGFSPITRLFLAPTSKHKSHSRKNSRQLYSEGWIEFASKKTARRCAETLNAQSVGGKKGGFYHDDIWNMKYLRGMRWDELMAGVREEKREVEGRRDEERRVIMRETKAFVEGVEEGRRVAGMKRKKEKQKLGQGRGEDGDGDDVKRTWRQFDVKGAREAEHTKKQKTEDRIPDDVKQVLGKIF